MPHGGIGVFVKNLAESLVALGVDVSVVGYGRKAARPFVQNGVKVYWLTLPNLLHKKVMFRGQPYSLAAFIKRIYLSVYLHFLCQRENFDLVESHDFSGPLAFKPPCPLVTRLHGSVWATRYQEGRSSFIHPVDTFYEKLQVQLATEVVAVSEHIARTTWKVMGFQRSFHVIYNSVDTEQFCPKPGTMVQKQILYVGRVMWRKGVFDLVRAVPGVLARHPDAQFVLAGGASGSHLEQLKQELALLSPEARRQVECLGEVSHDVLPELMNQSAVFVFPSHAEAFGLTCVEAMSCARPVVATRLVSGPELVEDGVSGLLADPTDPNDLAQKINTLLDDPALANQLGVNARQRVLDRFDLRDMASRNLDFYRTIVE